MSAFSYINYLSKPGQDIVVVLLTVDLFSFIISDSISTYIIFSHFYTCG